MYTRLFMFITWLSLTGSTVNCYAFVIHAKPPAGCAVSQTFHVMSTGNIDVPTSNVSANQYKVVAPGAASDGSQDQLLGVLTGTAMGGDSLLALVAAPSSTPNGGQLLACTCVALLLGGL